jgi:hypothetical protein
MSLEQPEARIESTALALDGEEGQRKGRRRASSLARFPLSLTLSRRRERGPEPLRARRISWGFLGGLTIGTGLENAKSRTAVGQQTAWSRATPIIVTVAR